jgi:hypothetical protein
MQSTVFGVRGTVSRQSRLLRALLGWWTVGRHYRPERRYMRGGLGQQGMVSGSGR